MKNYCHARELLRVSSVQKYRNRVLYEYNIRREKFLRQLSKKLSS